MMCGKIRAGNENARRDGDVGRAQFCSDTGCAVYTIAVAESSMLYLGHCLSLKSFGQNTDHWPGQIGRSRCE
jgi:hypothetical protein